MFAVLALVVGGCSPTVEPTSPVVPTPRATAIPTASPAVPTASPVAQPDRPTPEPFTPGVAWEPCLEPYCPPIVVEPGVTRAAVTKHGVRLTLEVGAASFSNAAGLTVTTTVENLGSQMLHWSSYGCEAGVGVGARTGWMWSVGADHAAPFQGFKGWVLEEFDPSTGPIRLRSSSGPFEGIAGDACPDVTVRHQLAPGRRVRFTSRISGLAGGPHGLAPAGPVLVLVTLHDWYRGKLTSAFIDTPSIGVTLPVELVDGRPPGLISAGQAVDVALGSRDVQDAVVRNLRLSLFSPAELAYDAAATQWLVSLTDAGNPSGSRRITVVIDALKAEIVEVRESP